MGGWGTTQPTNSITSSLQQPARREWGEEWVILNDRISNSSYPPPAHRTRPTRQPAKATVIQIGGQLQFLNDLLKCFLASSLITNEDRS